jgi:hypothetical protein
MTFLSLKNDVNVPSRVQKVKSKGLEVTDESSRIRIRIQGGTDPNKKYHGSTKMHWLFEIDILCSFFAHFYSCWLAFFKKSILCCSVAVSLAHGVCAASVQRQRERGKETWQSGLALSCRKGGKGELFFVRTISREIAFLKITSNEISWFIYDNKNI